MLREALIWWTVTLSIVLGLIVLSWLSAIWDRIDPEDKFLKKILGRKFYNFLNKNL